MIDQQKIRDETESYLTEIHPQRYESILIILYGSAARGNVTRKSDIDLLLIKEKWTQK